MGSRLLILALLLLLAAAIWLAWYGWHLDPVDVPAYGYADMILGIVLSLVVGCGLMFLVFYSSRKGYDEPPTFDRRDDDQA